MMSCLKLLILAPVYLETGSAGQEDDVLYERPSGQNMSSFTTACELKIDSPCSKESVQSARITQRTSQLDLLSSLPPGIDRNCLNFPFLTDRKTITYLNHKDTKIMFIMRGLSGSGKSLIAKTVQSSFQHAVICSADDYFYQEDGSYKFDQELLTAAHTACQQKAKKACRDTVPVIIIDNTNVKKWELKFYANLGNMSGYVVVLVQPRTSWMWDAEQLASRNKHGVSTEVLKRKIMMFDDMIPAYYGWFLNEKRSKCLTRLCSDILLECFSKFPKLKRDFLRELKIKLENVDAETATGILSEYFCSEDRRSPLLHCTAKYCSWGKAPEVKHYHQRPDVRQACGQIFVLNITGLIISKKSFGARIHLDPSQSIYFDHPEENDRTSNRLKSAPGYERSAISRLEDYLDEDDLVGKRSNRKAKRNALKSQKQLKKKQKASPNKNGRTSKNSEKKENDIDINVKQLENTNCVGGSDHGNGDTGSSLISQTQQTNEITVSLSEMFPSINYCQSARSAHLTIGTARGVELRQVKLDLLDACDVEAATVYTRSNFVSVSRGSACYYGDGLCCVYFDKPLSVRALFSGYY